MLLAYVAELYELLLDLRWSKALFIISLKFGFRSVSLETACLPIPPTPALVSGFHPMLGEGLKGWFSSHRAGFKIGPAAAWYLAAHRPFGCCRPGPHRNSKVLTDNRRTLLASSQPTNALHARGMRKSTLQRAINATELPKDSVQRLLEERVRLRDANDDVIAALAAQVGAMQLVKALRSPLMIVRSSPVASTI